MMEKHVGDSQELPCGVPPPGFRLRSGTRPGRVRLRVGDLERSLAWYGDVLGMQVLERSDGRAVLGAGPGGRRGAPRAAAGRPPGAAVPLVELWERPGAAPAPPRGRPGLYHFAVLLPDRASLGLFLHHLARMGERAGSADHMVSEAVYLRDPDGLGVEVYADRPRPEWRTRDRQIVMTTEPLDVRDVMDAAGGGTWSGVPPGTRIGHVHLHVGDLEPASAFYHEDLGLDRTVWSYPGALFLSAGGYHHHLGLNTWAASPSPPPEEEAQLLEWELLVPSQETAEGALSSLEAGGHAVERSGGGGLVRDPWGTALRIRPQS